MFEVLAYVYQNFDAGQSCPEASLLERRLAAIGFATDEIDDALRWLQGLEWVSHQANAGTSLLPPRATSTRIYDRREQLHLGPQAMGFLWFMESAALLPADLREIIIDRAMAAPGGPVSLEELKIIVLLVYWRLGQQPDALVLDELCTDVGTRTAH